MDCEHLKSKELFKMKVGLKNASGGKHVVSLINLILLLILLKVLFFRYEREGDRTNVRIIKQVKAHSHGVTMTTTAIHVKCVIGLCNSVRVVRWRLRLHLGYH